MDLSISDSLPAEDPNFSFRNHSDFVVNLDKTALRIDDYKGIEEDGKYNFTCNIDSIPTNETLCISSINNLKCSCGETALYI